MLLCEAKESMKELDGAIQKIELPKFTEGAWIYKRDGWYYLLYGYDFPEKVAYAMSRSIDGPWDFLKALLMKLQATAKRNSPAILDFKRRNLFHLS